MFERRLANVKLTRLLDRGFAVVAVRESAAGAPRPGLSKPSGCSFVRRRLHSAANGDALPAAARQLDPPDLRLRRPRSHCESESLRGTGRGRNHPRSESTRLARRCIAIRVPFYGAIGARITTAVCKACNAAPLVNDTAGDLVVVITTPSIKLIRNAWRNLTTE